MVLYQAKEQEEYLIELTQSLKKALSLDLFFAIAVGVF